MKWFALVAVFASPLDEILIVAVLALARMAYRKVSHVS